MEFNRSYSSDFLLWHYPETLEQYQLGFISKERLAEHMAIFDEIEAEYLAKETNKAA